MKVAVVVRINPLRAQLTVPEQFISAVAVGQPIAFEVDAYPGRQFAATIRYVSPTLQADRRALTVEAAVPNPNNELKPGLFATAKMQQSKPTPAILVPATAERASAGASRVYIVKGDYVEERVVTVGQSVDQSIEITSGLAVGDRVATANVAQLTDGSPITN
jgi:RND family efflux transporter MFP subunit